MKKNFLLRIDQLAFDEIKYKSELEDRSVNYMMCKLIDKGMDYIALNSDIEKEIEEYANKSRISKTELIETIWKIYKKLIKSRGD